MGVMRIAALLLVVLLSMAGAAQTPDVSKIGLPVGAAVPPIQGIDQFGRPQTLASISGPNGAMLVFFRSADW
jgi:hypothetical protein